MIVMYIFKYLNSIEDYLVNSIIVIFGYKPMQVKTERNRQPGTYIYRVQQILSLNMKTGINYTICYIYGRTKISSSPTEAEANLEISS